MFFAVFLGPLGPILTFVSLHVLIFLVIFLVWSILTFYFRYFLLQMLKHLPVGRLAFYFVRSFGSLPLIGFNRLFKVHGRWKSDSAKDGYVRDKVDSRPYVPLHIGI